MCIICIQNHLLWSKQTLIYSHILYCRWQVHYCFFYKSMVLFSSRDAILQHRKWRRCPYPVQWGTQKPISTFRRSEYFRRKHHIRHYIHTQIFRWKIPKNVCHQNMWITSYFWVSIQHFIFKAFCQVCESFPFNNRFLYATRESTSWGRACVQSELFLDWIQLAVVGKTDEVKTGPNHTETGRVI